MRNDPKTPHENPVIDWGDVEPPETINVTYVTGLTEHLEGENLSAEWDEISDTHGVAEAEYRVPRKSGRGTRVYGWIGDTNTTLPL